VSTISVKESLINEQIRDKEIRVIDSDGSQLGIMPTDRALDIATEKNLDLVNIAPHANPPVCKIMDYGKYRFEQSKREKEVRKNQHVVNVKELRLTLVIGAHDMETKVKQARRMLEDGDKVKISVRFRSRELNRSSDGIVLLNKFAEMCAAEGTVERAPKLEGRNMIMFLAPIKK
jgi:translation initiation factor IF-3